MSEDTTKAVWEKLQDTYHQENIHFKTNFWTKLHTINYDTKSNIEDSIISLEKIFVSFERLNYPADEKDRPGILLRYLPDEFSFLAIMVDSQNMDRKSIFVELKANAERRK